MNHPERYYPSEICLNCGKQHGRERHKEQVIGMWEGKCGWCGAVGPVTSPRDFLFPEWKVTIANDKTIA